MEQVVMSRATSNRAISPKFTVANTMAITCPVDRARRGVAGVCAPVRDVVKSRRRSAVYEGHTLKMG